jgi:hypothetical protein
MNEDYRDHIGRVNGLFVQAVAKAGFAGESIMRLRHLAAALLSDPGVRSMLAPLDLPTDEQLLVRLTSIEPIEKRLEEEAVRRGPGFVVLPPTQSIVGSDVFDCLSSVLSGNTLEGQAAYLALLRYVLGDETVRSALASLIDLSALEASLEQAMDRGGLP